MSTTASRVATTNAKTRRVVAGALAAGALAVPLALSSAPQAQAASLNGCTVTPLQPYVAVISGTPRVVYRTQVTCAASRIIQIRDYRYEYDAPAGIANDQYLGGVVHNRTFAAGATVVLSSTGAIPHTEVGNEEVYHRTSFRVATINGVTGWTSFQNSALRTVVG